MTGNRRKHNKYKQTDKQRPLSMSNENVHVPMPNENPSDNGEFGGTMRTMLQKLKWGFRMLIKPVDRLITFLFYFELTCYKRVAGRLPSLAILKNSDRLGELEDQNAGLNERMQSLQRELIQSKAENKENEDKYRDILEKLNWQHSANMQDVKERLRSTELEKEDALRRLSEIISVKLRDNNPNIVDLNDQCRPTKLAEMFSELYDNEWTNAYSVIANEFTEEQSIVILLDIVMEAYEYCSLAVNGSWEVLEQWFFTKDVRPSSEQQKVMKWLKDNRKAMVTHKVPEQSKIFKEKILDMCGNESIKLLLNDEDVDKYVEKCIELCLLMTANDPPVITICPDWKPCSQLMTEPEPTMKNVEESKESEGEVSGSDRAVISPLKKFSKDLYKEYTKRGQYLKYIVWPVMLLHKGGSTLAKGVAQGTNEIDGFEKFTWRVGKQC